MCILVVEDEPLVLLDLAEALRGEGFEVLTIGDAWSAMEMIAANPGRLTGLITDDHLPDGMNGGDLIVEVRSLYPDIPILLATATLMELTPGWLDEHRVTLAPKPYDTDVLAAQFRRSVST